MLGYAWGIVSNTGSVVLHGASLGWVLGSAAVSTFLAGVSYYRGHHVEAGVSLFNASVTIRDEFQPLVTAGMGGVPGIIAVATQGQNSNSHTVRVINHAGLVVAESALLAAEIVVDTAAIVAWSYHAIRGNRDLPAIEAAPAPSTGRELALRRKA